MEIELKLRIPAQALDALLADPLLQPAGKRRASRTQLDTRYFDTPERALAQAGIALRLRKAGRRWLQTVKSGGNAQAGLHQREEVEFAVAGPALEWQVLDGTPFGALIEPHRARQQPDVTAKARTELLLTGEAGAEIELAVDQGEIQAGRRREALCELELELKSGPVDDLFALASELLARHPLVLDNRSKAERGDALARDLPLAAPVKAAEPSLPPGAGAQTVARLAVANCVAQWQANEAGFLAQSPRDPLHNPGESAAAGSGWAARRLFAANSRAIGKKSSAADRPSSADRRPQGVMQRVPGASGDSEYLHQIRVAVRRLRVACDPLARLAGWHPEVLDAIRKPLRQLGRHLGAARDWDVFAEETWPLLQAGIVDAALRLALDEEIAIQRELTLRRAQAALHGRAAQGVLLQLSRCLAQPAYDAGPASESESKAVLNAQCEAYRLKLAHGAAKLESLKPQALHALRIAAKKLRYLIEFSADLHDAAAVEPWLKWLKKVQDLLGARNDRATAEQRIASLCKTLDARHGKVRRRLLATLDQHALPDMRLPPLPDAYWR